MAEVERYQELTREKELLNEKWDEQNSLLVEQHERVIAEVTDEYEMKLQVSNYRFSYCSHFLSFIFLSGDVPTKYRRCIQAPWSNFVPAVVMFGNFKC